jgi:DNA-binding MarR family transcriptional regulator
MQLMPGPAARENALSGRPESGAFILSEYLPYLVNRVGSRIAAAFSRELDRFDLTLPMWRVLAVLWHGGPLRQNELAAATSIEPSTMSRLLRQVERKRLVSRVRSAADQREIRVALTASGRNLTARIIPLALRYEAAAVGGLSRRETTLLKALLKRVYDNIHGPADVFAAKR